MTRYALHGYSIDSPLSLDLPVQPRRATAETPADMRLVRGPDRAVPPVSPVGRLLAEVMDDRRQTYYQFSRTGDEIVLRFHGLADFVGDERLSEITVHVDPAADPGLVPVLTGGIVIATRLILDGRLVLHASALRLPGGAVAFVGMSGMGKSTMAALGMAAGYTPLTDDVLRVDLASGGPALAWPGSTELRLRDSCQGLAEEVTRPSRRTADGRTAVSTGLMLDQPMPLACCVVPLPDRHASEPSVRVLDPFAALAQLLAFPRIVGWCDRDTTAQQFQQLGELCELVPVVEARLPWGPPFQDQLADRLFDRLDAALVTSLRNGTP